MGAAVNRLLPHPLTSAATFAGWLVVNSTLDPGHVALALLLAITLPPLLGQLVPEGRVRRPGLALRLLGTLLWDIVVANLQVARRILGPESAIRPRFVWVPLDIASTHGIVTLAAMITMTPGTLSAEISEDRCWLLVHALDVDDDAALVAGIKRRYEQPLMEILP